MQVKPLPVLTEYGTLYQTLYAIVSDYVKEQLITLQQDEEFGQKRTAEKIALLTYYSVINHLVSTVKSANTTLATEKKNCFSLTDIEQLKKQFFLNCLLDEKVCQTFVRELVDFAVGTLPLCLAQPSATPVVTYEWGAGSVCYNFQGTEYYAPTEVIVLTGGIRTGSFPVPQGATTQQILTITGMELARAEELSLSRYTELNDQVCCNEPLYDVPGIQLQTPGTDTLVFALDRLAPTAVLTVQEGETVLSSSPVAGDSITLTDLSPRTLYTLTVTNSSCKGNPENTISVQTGPLEVDIRLCDALQGQVQLTSGAEGITPVAFGASMSIVFSDTASPLYEVTSLTVNGDEAIGQVNFTQVTAGTKNAGQFLLSNITQDTVVAICGQVTNQCELIGLSFDSETATITVADSNV